MVWYRQRRFVLIAIAIPCLILSIVWYSARSWQDERVVHQTQVEPTQKNDPVINKSPGYLGPQACAACHHERVAEFMQTRHFRACYEPQSDGMPVGFRAGQNRFPSRVPEIEFEMTKTSQGFFQTAVHSTASGPETTSARIDLVYGSVPSDEVYFTWHGENLFELPVAWLHPQHEWAASTFSPDQGGDYSRPMSVRCLECHTTWFEHVSGTANQFKRDHFILGVTCERCHGPGQEHVEFHQAHPDHRQGMAIVQPHRLSRELLIEVCTQCHSNAIRHRGPAFSYRPGQPLDESYRTVTSRYPEDDHVANQIKYLRESECFQKSETMTCVTCHNPHRSPESTVEHDNPVKHACITCHQPTHCTERARIPEPVQDKCIDCHMPVRDKIQVYFDTAKDSYVAPVKAFEHRIGIYSFATQEVLRNWYREQPGSENHELAENLTAKLVSYWDGQGDQMRRQYRHLAAIDAYRRVMKLSASAEVERKLKETIADRVAIDSEWIIAQRQIRQQQFKEAATTLEDILRRKPDHASASGRLGTVYASLGQRAKAVEALEAVARFDPDDAYGEAMLGWMAYLDGNYQSAVDHYRRADEIEPCKAKLQYQWGLAYFKMEAWEQAEERFRQALAIDPNLLDACTSLVQLFRNRGQLEEANKFEQRATGIRAAKASQ